MTVIDVDSHFYEPFDWLDTTDAELLDALPKVDKATLVATTAFGEVLSGLPPEYRPDPLAKVPPALRNEDGSIKPEMVALAEAGVVKWIDSVEGAHRPAERLAYMDAQGIDKQFVLPTFAFNPIAHVRRTAPEQLPKLLHAYNDWACGVLEPHNDRLIAVPVVDLRTMTRDEVTTELTACRQRGPRSFLFWPSPVEGKSLAHPDYEWFWACAADLGLLPQVHVGAGRPQIDLGWLENGRDHPSRLLAYFGQLNQIPELVLTELLAAGIFERHPNLRLIVAELGIDWLPAFMARADRLAKMGGPEHPWPLPLLPSEYLRRQVRVSPLRHDPAADVIERVGDGIVVFSSDYPHPEGGADAVATFKRRLDAIEPATVENFFGGTIAADLALGA